MEAQALLGWKTPSLVNLPPNCQLVSSRNSPYQGLRVGPCLCPYFWLWIVFCCLEFGHSERTFGGSALVSGSLYYSAHAQAPSLQRWPLHSCVHRAAYRGCLSFLLVEMNKNPLSSLSVTSGKNYGRGRILFVQVHLGIDYDTQGNLHLPKPIFHGSDPCSLSLNFYKSVQISLWEKVHFLLLLFVFQKLKVPDMGFKDNFLQIFS